MATSHVGASGTSSSHHHPSADYIGFKAEGPASSATSTGLQALEHAERSLADLNLFLNGVRDTMLSTSSSARLCLANPHLKARRELRARQKRNTLFCDSLFSDPAWDILLNLFAAHAERNSMVVRELTVCTGVPMTTTLRWISTLEVKGLVWRRGNQFDRRIVDVGLTERGIEAMLTYFAE